MMMFRRNSTDADQALALFELIRSDVFEAMDLAGAQVEDAWKEEISIDVEYGQNAFGQYEVVRRSDPGQPPRRETHNLYDSIQSTTEADADEVTTLVATDVEYGFLLEGGHGKVAARPHRDPIFATWSDPFVDAVVKAVAG